MPSSSGTKKEFKLEHKAVANLKVLTLKSDLKTMVSRNEITW